jgi:hypothetical protein
MGFLSVALGRTVFPRIEYCLVIHSRTEASRIPTRDKEGLVFHWEASARLTSKVCPSLAPEMQSELLQWSTCRTGGQLSAFVPSCLLPRSATLSSLAFGSRTTRTFTPPIPFPSPPTTLMIHKLFTKINKAEKKKQTETEKKFKNSNKTIP